MLMQDLISNKKAANRLGTTYDSDFVKEAIDERGEHSMYRVIEREEEEKEMQVALQEENDERFSKGSRRSSNGFYSANQAA